MSTLSPHGACLLWKPGLIWLNAVSDAMVCVAFFATAFVLGFYVWRRRREVMFRCVFWALASPWPRHRQGACSTLWPLRKRNLQAVVAGAAGRGGQTDPAGPSPDCGGIV